MSTPLAGAFAPRPLLLRRASDARLARLASAGSEAAIAEIFERYHQALHRYCFTIVGNGHDAADALQNTMVKALRSLPGETREITLRPWLYRVAHNESISLLRARCTDADLDAAAAVGDPAADGLIDSRQELRDLAADLAELTERQRAALLMREIGDLEFAEVAAALDTSAAAVKQSVYEARCALHAMREGRAMTCDDIRRELSDGDRRILRGVRMRSHLRACAGCRDFEVALHARPAQLNAMIPPLPLAVAAAMLHGGLGIGGGSAGGGLAAGVAGGAKATTGLTLGAKAAAVVAVTATLGSGAAYVVPAVRDAGGTTGRSGATVPAPAAVTTRSAATTGTSATVSPKGAIHRSAGATAKHPAAASAGAATHAAAPASPAAATGRPAGSGRPTTIPGSRPISSRGKSAAAAGRKRAANAKAKAKASARKPATLPARRPAVTPSRPAAIPPAAAAPPRSPASPAGANGTPAGAAGTALGATPGPGAAAAVHR